MHGIGQFKGNMKQAAPAINLDKTQDRSERNIVSLRSVQSYKKDNETHPKHFVITIIMTILAVMTMTINMMKVAMMIILIIMKLVRRLM